MKKKLLSGVKPTGRPHIGNYFGAMKQFVEMQDQYESKIMIADYHALNTIQNAKEMNEKIIDLMLDYMAIGLDPDKVVIFKQSDVSAHTELAWIFDTITTMPYLMRAHAYKDAQAKDKEISVGTFNYPMLMAADILLYDTDIVPVGKDQKQHIEYARDTAQKFNKIYGTTFNLPKDMILEDVAIVPGTDGQKMSKSYGNTIPLFATQNEIKEAVMKIPTDSKGVEEKKNPDTNNIYNIHKLFLNEEKNKEVRAKYENGGLSYKEAKEMLISDIESFISPLREKRSKLELKKNKVIKTLKRGGKIMNKEAQKKMSVVKDRLGVNL
jgi:tryptophanyl-tRNA synthetase